MHCVADLALGPQRGWTHSLSAPHPPHLAPLGRKPSVMSSPYCMIDIRTRSVYMRTNKERHDYGTAHLMGIKICQPPYLIQTLV